MVMSVEQSATPKNEPVAIPILVRGDEGRFQRSRIVIFAMNKGPYTQFPANLPVPPDDGARSQLPGKPLPDIALLSTSNHCVNLRRQSRVVVLYAYSMTGRPGVLLPEGWDAIPGARAGRRSRAVFATCMWRCGGWARKFFGLGTVNTNWPFVCDRAAWGLGANRESVSARR
jgi:hypothetical protein